MAFRFITEVVIVLVGEIQGLKEVTIVITIVKKSQRGGSYIIYIGLSKDFWIFSYIL